MTQRFCKKCGGWHTLENEWPEACAGHYRQASPSGIQIIKDIEPYRAVAADVNGKRPAIGSRREHREFLKRNNYHEIGNEIPKHTPQSLDLASKGDIRRAMQQVRERR